MRIIIACFVLFSFFHSEGLIAQENEPKPKRLNFSLEENKGKFFFFWGYNRTVYAKSKIRLIGEDYDFTLSKVKANDLPSEFNSDYINPGKLTVPQFNVRIGYFINDKYAIAIGWDHMKYRTLHGSMAIIDGRIDSSASIKYAGTYSNQAIEMNTNDLVKMEHSDGFNIINVNLERHDLLYKNKTESVAFNLVTGAGAGIAIPWTNAFIFGARTDDRPHFSGLGAQLFIAPEGIIYKHLFIRYTLQGGFASMWDVATTAKNDNSSHAEQTIYYLEQSVVLGYRFKIFK